MHGLKALWYLQDMDRRPAPLDSQTSCSSPQLLCGSIPPGRSFFSGPAKPGKLVWVAETAFH